MYLLEKRVFWRPLGIWKAWEAKIAFDKDNSTNPKKEALQAFEKIPSVAGEFWRVTHNGRLIIEQR